MKYPDIHAVQPRRVIAKGPRIAACSAPQAFPSRPQPAARARGPHTHIPTRAHKHTRSDAQPTCLAIVESEEVADSGHMPGQVILEVLVEEKQHIGVMAVLPPRHLHDVSKSKGELIPAADGG